MLNIFALSLDGESVPIEGQKNDSVIILRRNITSKLGLHENNHKMVYNGIILDDDSKTMEECGITENSSVGIIFRLIGGTMVFAETEDGKRVVLEILLTDKVIDLKKKIHEKTGMEPDELRLVFNRKTLIDDNSLSDYGIVDNSIIDIVSRNKIMVYVTTFVGQTFTVDIKKDDAIPEVKNKIEAKTGIDASSCDIVFDGKVLEDEKTVADYDIMDSCTFTMISKLDGGL